MTARTRSEQAEEIAPGEVHAAHRRLSRHLTPSPLVDCPFLADRAGVPVRLKLECLQPTRSFKVRGALNALLGWDGQAGPVVAASAGNHGAGLAHASAILGGPPVRIFVPGEAPRAKVETIRALGAEVTEVSGGYDAAEREAKEHAAGMGLRFVSPYEDALVVAGQGTVALELAAQWPGLEGIVLPIGGGGLAAGVGAALRELGGAQAPAAAGEAGGAQAPAAAGEAGRAIVVHGVQSEATPAMHAAFAAGAPVTTPDRPTLADGLSGAVSLLAFRRARAALDAIFLVSETAIADAIRFLHDVQGVVVEGSGAVAAAAIASGVLRPTGPTAIVISGGNIDADRLARIVSGAPG